MNFNAKTQTRKAITDQMALRLCGFALKMYWYTARLLAFNDVNFPREKFTSLNLFTPYICSLWPCYPSRGVQEHWRLCSGFEAKIANIVKCLLQLRVALFIILTLFLTGCGYQVGEGGSLAHYQTITIPFVDGDANGDMTAALVKEITRSGAFQYQCANGQLVLCVKILEVNDYNIGFRYDINKDCKITNSLIPTETRVYAIAEVAVTDACSGCTLLGPVEMKASVDFDHDYYSSRDGVNIFSLGQLSDIDAARDAVYQPLYRELSEKIVDYIAVAW